MPRRLFLQRRLADSRKCSASTGMSSGRSRSGGTRIGHHREAVEQVAAERPPLGLRLEVLVGGGDEADVDLHRAVRARPR